MAPPPVADWIKIEGVYRAGIRSVESIAREFEISGAAIHKHAKKHGWVRNPEGTKREMVRAALSGFSVDGFNDGERLNHKTISDETAQDIRDMQAGLSVARLCIDRLMLAVVTATDPKEIKIIAEANKTAIETIRKVRGLDDPQKTDDDLPLVIVRNFTGGKTEEQDGGF